MVKAGQSWLERKVSVRHLLRSIFTRKRAVPPAFSLPRFVLVITLSLASFLFALALLAPETWSVQLAGGVWAVVAMFINTHFATAFVEYFFHRYVLHASLIPGLSYFHKQHVLHHGLTRIVRRRVAGEETLRIENRYPIVESSQHEASFFPWYTFAGFGLLSTPLFALVQLVLPRAPVFLGGYLALWWALLLYETLHAFEHWPLARWQPLLDSPRWGRWWKKFYAFHLRHHADVRSNESISGFFGFPLADLVFGTYVGAVLLYEDRAIVTGDPFASPTSRFIRWLDRRVARKGKRK